MEALPINAVAEHFVSRGFHYYWIFYLRPILILLIVLIIIFLLYKILKD